MFCMFPDSKSECKKWATGQSFIQKEITSYRIGTLVIVSISALCSVVDLTNSFWNLLTFRATIL